MKTIITEVIITKQCEFTAQVPDSVFEKGKDEIRKFLDSKIDNELDYADTFEQFNYIEE